MEVVASLNNMVCVCEYVSPFLFCSPVYLFLDFCVCLSACLSAYLSVCLFTCVCKSLYVGVHSLYTGLLRQIAVDQIYFVTT